MTELKVISLWQPWASLVAEGVKTIETRGRQHPWRSAIGQRIAIHATAKRLLHVDTALRIVAAKYAMHYGAVLATCTLTDVLPIVRWRDAGWRDRTHPCVVVGPSRLDISRGDEATRLRRFDMDDGLLRGVDLDVDQLPFGDYAPGRFALLFDDIVKLPEPIPARGHQGLWRWNA